MNKQFIYNYLNYLRVIIAIYIRSKYCLDPLSANNAQEKIALVESQDGIAQRVVGLINSSNNDIRLEIVENRDINTLKTIIEKHILKGNII